MFGTTAAVRDALTELDHTIAVRVRESVREAIQEEESAQRQLADARKETKRLHEEIERLKIEKSRKEEAFAREERELKHMIGLEKRRQEFEIDQTTRETTVSVREENLAADRTRFEEQMKFTQDRFEKEVGYLKTLMEQILLRLPTVKVNMGHQPNGHKETLDA